MESRKDIKILEKFIIINGSINKQISVSWDNKQNLGCALR